VWWDLHVSERKLRYSERKLLAETGGPAPLGNMPTEPLRNAMVHLLAEADGRRGGKPFGRALQDQCVKYVGWPPNQMSVELGFLRFETEPFLDLVELFTEKASKNFKVWHAVNNWQWRKVLPGVESEINELFERHCFGYRLEEGEIRTISSPALEKTLIGPALLAVARPEWEEAERSFREALAHQRGGEEENDDALTAANAALEAALKAAGFAGTHLAPLARDFKTRSPVPPSSQVSPGLWTLC
jgi:hypothetical protein